MELLPLKSNLVNSYKDQLPLSVYTVGTEIQPPVTRMKGFSAHQLFLTVSGSGCFRRLGTAKDKWDMLNRGDLLFIPAGCAHEYASIDEEPWQVAYVTFWDNFGHLLNQWGLHTAPRLLFFPQPYEFVDRIYHIWRYAGSEHDPWLSSEYLLSLLLHVMKHNLEPRTQMPLSARPATYRDPVVESAVQFIQDHLNRPLTIAKLAEYVGYSQRQLTRLFRKELHATPLQYVLTQRMRIANMLLHDHPDLTIRQVAAYVGMEPNYFTRVYKKMYHKPPSERVE